MSNSAQTNSASILCHGPEVGSEDQTLVGEKLIGHLSLDISHLSFLEKHATTDFNDN